MRGKVLEWTFRICVIAPVVLPGWVAVEIIGKPYSALAEYLHDVARWLGGRDPSDYELAKRRHKGYNSAAGTGWIDYFW
jgi:hypothetical protein